MPDDAPRRRSRALAAAAATLALLTVLGCGRDSTPRATTTVTEFGGMPSATSNLKQTGSNTIQVRTAPSP